MGISTAFGQFRFCVWPIFVERAEHGLAVRHLVAVEVAAVEALGFDRLQGACFAAEGAFDDASGHIADLGEEVRLTLVGAHLPLPLPPRPLRLQPIVVSYRYVRIYAETVIAARVLG